MPEHRAQLAHLRLEAELVDLEARALLAELLVDLAANVVPGDAVRGLHPWERLARVDFRRIADEVAEVTARVTRRLLDDRARALAIVDGELAASRVIDYGHRLGDPALLGPRGPLGALADGAVEPHRADLERSFRLGMAGAVDEAARQGVPARLLVEAVDVELPELVDADLRARAARMATTPHRELLARMERAAFDVPYAPEADYRAAVMRAGYDAPTAGVATDHGQANVSNAHGAGRIHAGGLLPRASLVYASELLDGNTCRACSRIDGTEYATEEEARADYPLPEGRYVRCEGGPRCRGTLVRVWAEEEATVQDAPPPLGPDPLPPPPGRPATPRAPRGPDPLAAELGIDEDELRVLRRQVEALRRAARLEAARIQNDAIGILENADAVVMRAPPRAVVRRRGDGSVEVRRPGSESGGYDFLEGLHPDERKRLQRFWLDRSAVQGPDEIDDMLQRFFGTDSPEAGVEAWLRLGRTHDAAGALARGRLPARDAYSGAIDPGDLMPELRAQGYDAEALFGNVDDAARHVRRVHLDQLEDYADSLADDALDLAGLPPERMTTEAFVEEYGQLRRAYDTPGAEVDYDRLLELVPDEFAAEAERLSPADLHRLIVDTRNAARAREEF